jgi:hypothetical protein
MFKGATGGGCASKNSNFGRDSMGEIQVDVEGDETIIVSKPGTELDLKRAGLFV